MAIRGLCANERRSSSGSCTARITSWGERGGQRDMTQQPPPRAPARPSPQGRRKARRPCSSYREKLSQGGPEILMSSKFVCSSRSARMTSWEDRVSGRESVEPEGGRRTRGRGCTEEFALGGASRSKWGRTDHQHAGGTGLRRVPRESNRLCARLRTVQDEYAESCGAAAMKCSAPVAAGRRSATVRRPRCPVTVNPSSRASVRNAT
jgi:hypothetical protein